MNFSNELFSNNLPVNQQVSPLSPLTILTPRQSSSNELWSPFATPCFSPYHQTSPHSTQFEFSSMNSPLRNCLNGHSPWPRAISKSPISRSRDLHVLGESTNQTQYSSSSSVSLSRGNDRTTMSPSANENLSPEWSLGSPSNFHSPKSTNVYMQPNSPASYSKLPKRSEQIDMSDFLRQSAAQRAMGGRSKLCTFCKTNGESEAIYTSHSLKDASDKITCPILMKYSCPVCGASGEKTHTKKYCPVLQKKTRSEMLKKLAVAPNSSTNF